MGVYFNMFRLLYISFIILLFDNVDSANILVVIPYSGKSHYILHRPIGLELARRGHNVTVITPYIETEHAPSYHQIKVRDKKIYETSDDIRPNLFDINEITFGKFQNIIYQGSLAISEMTFTDKAIQEFLRINQTFDAVICEHFYLESMYIFAHIYKAPLILLSSCGSSMKHNIATRNPLQLATLQYEFFIVKDPTSFLGRLANFYYTFYDYLWWRFWYLVEEEKLINKYVPNLPQPVPSLYDMQRNASLFLMNTHFSFDPPAAYLPNLIDIAGIHLSDDISALPEDLQKILDNSKNGVVYVNFGSHLKSVELPLDKKNAFMNIFSKLEYTVLWKWEEENLTNRTDNVIIRNWLPQKEILAHPNIKVFISHGGLLGTIEAIDHGVPVIGVPIYGDQYNNLLQLEYAGTAKILQYKNINEYNLEIALEDVLKDDTYKNRAKELSVRFKDRPMNALDTAIYWIEYVLRNRGGNYMQNPAMKLNWFAYNMLDVYGFLLFFILVVILLQVKFIKCIANFNKAVDLSKKCKIKSN